MKYNDNYNVLLVPVRFAVALVICLIALFLPYKLRVLWFKLVSETVHFPFKIFGRLARFLMKQLEIQNLHE